MGGEGGWDGEHKRTEAGAGINSSLGRRMNNTPESLVELRKLRAETKFVEANLYPGAPDENTRMRCEAVVNLLIDDVLALLGRDASKDEVLTRAKQALDSFSMEDTEERERADDYVADLMRAIGIDDWTDYI